MKVIFLDVDGVLNTHKYTVFTQDDEYHTYKFLEKNKLALLRQIIDKTGAKIVLSSTWKADFDDHLQPNNELGLALVKALENEGLILFAKTDSIDNNRYLEIKSWLQKSPQITDFVIIDDHDFDWKDLRNNWFKTSFYIGLNQLIADEIIRFLNHHL